MKHILLLMLASLLVLTPTEYGQIHAQSKKTTTTQNKSSQKTNSKKTTKKEDINKLKKQEKSIKDKVNKTDKQLVSTQKSTKQSLQELERLDADIEYRDNLIRRRSTEIDDINLQIDSLNKSVKELNKECEGMRKKYADMLYYAYMTKGQQSKLLYILSSKSFQEGYRRYQYLNNLADLCKEQSIELDRASKEIQNKRDKMSKLKAKTEELLTKQQQEKGFALIQKEKQSNLVASLRTKEKELKQALKEQQKEADALDRKIQELIAKQAQEEAERAAAEARRKAQQQKQAQNKQTTANQQNSKPTGNNSSNKTSNTTKTTTPSNTSLSQQDKTLSTGFTNSKGLLMWPVKGTIVSRFGEHTVIDAATIKNNGIKISTTPGAKAMAVYDGVVSSCFSVPGNNNGVIIRHGNYLTIYANLTEIYVKKGQTIKRNSPIGKVYSESDNKNKTTLFFGIWKERTALNPQPWLKH